MIGEWNSVLANILSEWLRNSEKGTLGSENLKHFSGEHPPEPPHKRSVTPSVLVKEIS